MKNSVSLKIQGKTYQIKYDQDPSQLHSLADFVEKKMQEISNSTTVQSTLDLAILTLLNMAKDLQESQKSREELEKNVNAIVKRYLEKIKNEISLADPL